MPVGLSPVPPKHRYAPAIPQDVPVYRVTNEKGFYVDDQLFPQDEIVIWKGEPNPKLDPLNKMAEDIMVEYLTKLDKFGKDKARIDKKSYRSELDAFITKRGNLDGDDNRRIRSLTQKNAPSVLGTPRTGTDSVQKLIIEETTPILSIPSAE